MKDFIVTYYSMNIMRIYYYINDGCEPVRVSRDMITMTLKDAEKTMENSPIGNRAYIVKIR